MRATSRIITFIIAACALAAPVLAQDAPDGETQKPPSEHIMFGALGAGVLNIHRGEFSTYDGILECGVFNNTTTLGWMAGNVLDIPFGGGLALSTRIYYRKANGDFTSPNPVQPNISLDDGTLVRMTTENTLETSLDYVMLDLLGKWSFTRLFYAAVGPTVGLSTRAAYEQEERIISPNGVTFANGQNARNIIAGNFDEQGTRDAQRNLHIAATAALGADIPISEHFVLNPEVGYSLPFTNVLSTFEWKVSAARAGLALKYMFGDEKTVIVEAPPVEVPPAAEPRPVIALDANNQLENGTRLNYAQITMTEDRLSDVMPLLPYVFFDANSSTLPDRYHELTSSDVAAFSESRLRDSVLGIYHDVLNIIGDRMKRYPEATITVTGCREPIEDKNGAEISNARAEQVKSYLVSTWNIDPMRIKTASRVLPQAVSNRTITDGREENRRAEISSSDLRILAPVERTSVDRTLDPAAVVMIPKVQFGAGIRSWKLDVNAANGKSLYSTSGSGAPSQDVVWKLNRNEIDNAIGNAANGQLTAVMTSELNAGGQEVAQRQIPVQRIVRSKRISGEIVRDSVLERYALMFFDFDTPNVSDFNSQVVKLIQDRMRTSSAVRITGLTDRIGETAYNQTLSQQRAGATAKRIQSRIVPEQLAATGAGETLIYNNDLPEGRFYNRTVVIEIATPTSD